MKISNLIKQLSELKKKHGDILIGFDAASFNDINFPIDDDENIFGIRIQEVATVRYDDAHKKHKTVILEKKY